jgi:hypothetical protein
MTAEEALRSLLTEVDSECRLAKYGVGQVHIVLDADGETLGQGSTEIEAMTDTIRRSYVRERDDLAKLRAKTRAFNDALAGLGDVYESES